MDELKTLESMGLTLPTPAYLIGALLFGIFGLAAYRYGKKASLQHFRWIGVVLMLFPYAVSETWLLYLVGAVLCAGLYISHRYAN